ncbi:hypothetical protein CKO28_01320 [Rhodovibrio sodomensis]|uniref:Uncharacterized protein n=1 Tax=Rhodovibrio sodomensis TaxID=1088 RepID=A0ABS1D8D9_9PROT|nr:hypothetical protein [Rhodovibrio sodomensis]MBK1666684.1 hypothetical protein [Rhodovibrio sodomensis]
MSRPTKSFINAFDQAVRPVIERHGLPDPSGRHAFRIDSDAGGLGATVYDTWIAMRFDDVAQAHVKLGRFATQGVQTRSFAQKLNPHSGKWNAVYLGSFQFPQAGTDIDAFCNELTRHLSEIAARQPEVATD